MPIIKSAKKRVRVAAKATIRNSKTKRLLKVAMKLFGKSPVAETASSAQSAIDTAAKKGIMHKNKAARLKRQLSARAKAATVTADAAHKPTSKPVADASPVVKKASAKKPAAKKLAVKKAPAKKPAQ